MVVACLLQLEGNGSRSSCNWLWQPPVPAVNHSNLNPASKCLHTWVQHRSTTGRSCAWYRIKELYQVQTHSCNRYSCSKCLHTSLTAARVIRSPALLILLNSVFFFGLRPHFYFILPSFAFFFTFFSCNYFLLLFQMFSSGFTSASDVFRWLGFCLKSFYTPQL